MSSLPEKPKIGFCQKKKASVKLKDLLCHLSLRNKQDLEAICFKLIDIEVDICLPENYSGRISGRNAKTERQACYLGKNSQGRSTAEGEHFNSVFFIGQYSIINLIK